MASTWPAGAVFAVGWLILWTPIFIIAMIWFKERRDIQPIKARSPSLVLVTDVILVLYTISLCFQRIIENDYPCILNMWSGYAGTVILFNSYLWRCWTLYFNFNLTHVRLQRSTRSLAGEDGGAANFFIRNRWMTGGAFLSKVAGGVFCLLMIPPFALSVSHTSIAQQSGDGCDQSWGPTVLAVYVAAYVALFSWFSFSLRSVVDGFKIKAELKATGFIALLAVIPWFVFNNYASRVNNETFPFSTMFILIAILAAFSASTIYPLWASFFGVGSQAPGSGPGKLQPGMSAFALIGSGTNKEFHPLPDRADGSPAGSTSQPGFNAQGHPERLYQILEDQAGIDAFTQFLTKEFSVENIVFYREIEKLRSEIRTKMTEQSFDTRTFLMKGKLIHEKYIQPAASYQVNLPDPVVRNCEAHLKYEAYLHGIPIVLGSPSNSSGKKHSVSEKPKEVPLEDWSTPPPPQQPPMDHLDKTTPTLFDDAQRTIYLLMEKDSMLRFVRSDLYKTWYTKIVEEEHKNKVLSEMNLV